MAKSTGIGSVLGGLVALGALSGCTFGSSSDWTSVDNPPVPVAVSGGGASLFKGKVTRANAKVAPIAAGTLAISKDNHAYASDPDRDQVHVVDLASKNVTSVKLQAGDEPGRVVEGEAGVAYVAARRGGVVLRVEAATGGVSRIPVCAAPRGLAFDATASKLFVACRSGVLATVDTSTQEVTDRFQLDADLRDVMLQGDRLALTRFKNAEVLLVSRQGELLSRSQPSKVDGLTPAVAYRALSAPGGGVLVGHVDSSDATLPSGVGAYYGSPCGGSVADVKLAMIDTEAPASAPSAQPQPMSTKFSLTLAGMTGPVDLAYSGDGARLAVVAAGNNWSPDDQAKPSLFVTSAPSATSGTMFQGGCVGSVGAQGALVTKGEAVAVAFDSNNRYVVQSRQPAQLELEGGEVISLAGDDRSDTGLAMFHMNTGGGISCNSCHPEAGEDGHTWHFQVGLRRSQELKGGFSSRAPFHWTGDLGDFDALFDEVMIKRMSLFASVSAEQRGALKDWLDTVPPEVSADSLDPEAVERGRVLFSDSKTACITCHSGTDYTDNKLHNVGTGAEFITPSLVGVNTRAPLFHDGCTETLAGRFGPCGGGDSHGVTSQLTASERADLVAFMQSL